MIIGFIVNSRYEKGGSEEKAQRKMRRTKKKKMKLTEGIKMAR